MERKISSKLKESGKDNEWSPVAEERVGMLEFSEGIKKGCAGLK